MKTHATPSNGRWQLWWSPFASRPRRTRTRSHLTRPRLPAAGLELSLRLIGLPFVVALACVLVAALSLLFATAPHSVP